MEEFEYVEKIDRYRLGKTKRFVEVYLDDMMEWTVKSISFAPSNRCLCNHNVVMSYDFDSKTNEYKSRVIIARLIPIHNECVKHDLRVSMNDKIKLELIPNGKLTGNVDILIKCFVPENCDITKESPFNTIQRILRERNKNELREKKMRERRENVNGNNKINDKKKKNNKNNNYEDGFDETMGNKRKPKRRDDDMNGALVDESLTLEGFLNAPGEIVKQAEGLMYRDHNQGTGEPLKTGQRARIKCSGRLANGHFFQRAKKGDSFDIRVGGGELIKGLEKALVGMRVGGTRTVVVPPGLGYGSKGTRGIPGGSTLIFEVRLIAIDAPLEAMTIMKKKGKK